MTTKVCPKCQSTELVLIGTHELKICNNCGEKIHWPRDEDQQPLVPNNRVRVTE